MEEEGVRGWVEDYVVAWNSNEPGAIVQLFTADAEYYTDPYGPAWVGRDAIVEQWLAHADRPGETSFEWDPLVIAGDVAVVTGTTTYPHTVYSNLRVIRLDGQRRCASSPSGGWSTRTARPAEPADRGQPARSAMPRTYAAWPTCCRQSLITLTSRTPSVTGGSHRSSTIRARSPGSRLPRNSRVSRSTSAW